MWGKSESIETILKQIANFQNVTMNEQKNNFRALLVQTGNKHGKLNAIPESKFSDFCN